jgi:FKBP-type peptidyl-prolyl cis-trans isomerase SlyD
LQKSTSEIFFDTIVGDLVSLSLSLEAQPPMITADKVVSIHYTVHDQDNQFIESTRDDEPKLYLHGHQNINPAIEKSLEGLAPGATAKVILPPEEAYGEYDERLLFTVSAQQFGSEKPEPGMMVQATSDNPEEPPLEARVVKVDGDTVTMDANHVLAGKSLCFSIEVLNVREATDDEKAHGHPHDPNHPHHH